jgi:plastocyanin
MKKLLTKAAAFLLLCNFLFMFSGCQNSADNSAKTQASSAKIEVVTIKDFAFGPQNLEIKAGDEVNWVNGDSATHSVILNGEFDSGAIKPGSSFNHRFEKAGRYEYKCSIHPTMIGVIDVK